eukprot:CAMPEP_0171900230 /NCGR_PEP_ID=MMETSP0992-20121227/49670_1 /TAXON_ID=483369 /ORGANISM="non described non described, Strain CCMP2098" /LENGTH=107 /DNA_ID=CAMNT_0012528635 /DNA_START=195 /DNA_END=514 /DNA_ORIENTATION=+
MSSSDTVTISSTRSRTTGHVLDPSVVRRPSATVLRATPPTSTSPRCLLRSASSMASGSAPTTSMRGHNALHATAHPLTKPPPPTGTTRTSNGPSPPSGGQLSGPKSA